MGDVNRSAIPPATGSYCDMIPTSRGGKTFFRIPPLFPPRETDLQQILPPSRRTKAFFERFYRLPAAENRFSEIFFHFPPREGVFEGQRSVSRLILAFPESMNHKWANDRCAQTQMIESLEASWVGSNDPIILGHRGRNGSGREEGGSTPERFLDRFDGGAEVLIDVHLILDRLAGVQYGGMVLPANHLTDA